MDTFTYAKFPRLQTGRAAERLLQAPFSTFGQFRRRP